MVSSTPDDQHFDKRQHNINTKFSTRAEATAAASETVAVTEANKNAYRWVPDEEAVEDGRVDAFCALVAATPSREMKPLRLVHGALIDCVCVCVRASSLHLQAMAATTAVASVMVSLMAPAQCCSSWNAVSAAALQELNAMRWPQG